ncbi:MAG: PEP-CTERM sorting domain-containing protein [Pirellulales bacterium]|nr:PEP-CTERM sorting domain-containing protein [Pirellulales bacterium]
MTVRWRMAARVLVAVAWACLGSGTAVGDITLSQDFDSGSLDVAASSVSGNTVSLVGRKTWTQTTPFNYSKYYRWVYFKASDVQGLTPTFQISSSAFLGDLSDHRYVYSYDQENWSFFDQGQVNTTTAKYVFGNTTAFAQDEVYIAYSLPYPVTRTIEHIARVAMSPFVSPTTSGTAGLVIGQSAGGTDDTGRTVSPHDLYGYKITDPSATGPKFKVLLAGGNHSCETMGNHALEGMIDFLLGSSPQAVALRRAAEFFVYPQVNPDGREAGYYRSSPENPDQDYNRVWNDPTGFTDLTAVRDAMILDTGGKVDYLFDFHGMFGPWSRDPYYSVSYSDLDYNFTKALAELEPTIIRDVDSGDPGMLRIWGSSASGLDAAHAFTAEFGAHPGVLEDRLDEMGANYARALGMVIAPVEVPEPATLVLLLAGIITLLLKRRFRRSGRA